MTLADKIRPLALAGLGPYAIADQLYVNRSSVKVTMSKMRRAGEPIPLHTAGRQKKINTALILDRRTEEALVLEGAKRGMSRRSITNKILNIVARDDLFHAVLDGDEDKK